MLRLVSCVVAVHILCSICVHGLTWNRVDVGSDIQPSGRLGFAFGYDELSNRLIVFGGFTSDGYKNDTWIFDIASGNWTELQPADAPKGRFEAYFGMLRVAGESLFVVTMGFQRTEEFDDVWVFRFSTMDWTSITPLGRNPGARYGGHFGAVYGDTDTLWVGSGFTGTTPLPTRYIDTYKLIFTSATAARWEEVYPQPSIGNQFMPLNPHGRCLQASAVVEEGLVMAGGCMRGGTGGGPCPTDDTWFFNDTTSSWIELNRCITPRTWSKMAPLSNNPDKVLLYGGNDNFAKQLLNVASRYTPEEVFIFDTASKQWTRHLTTGVEFPYTRYQFGMVAGANGVIYVFAGRNLSNNANLDDLWELSGDISAAEEVACNNVWFSYAHLHGILMFLAFGLLFPLGVTVAQLLRCKKSKAWFIIHVICQLTAPVLAVIAFIIIFAVSERAGSVPTHPHAIIGILLMTFMFIQPINGIFRPHIKDGEKSKYRVCWEWFHRIYGSFIVLLGFTQVTLGVFLIVPPLPVWVIWLLILATWALVFIIGNTARIICCCCSKDKDEEKEDQEMKHLHP